MAGLTSTYIIKTFQAKIVKGEGGKKKLELASTLFWQHTLNKFATGDPITVTLTNKKPKRTEQQNKYYWMYLSMISEETGQDIDDLHALFKGLFLSKGIVEIMGHKIRRAKSTTELTTLQFMEFIKRIEELTGVLAPPTENYVLGIKKKDKRKTEYPEGEYTGKF